MSIKRWSAKRDANEPDIVKALRATGTRVWLLPWTMDLLCLTANRFWILEVKMPKGALRESQVEFIDQTTGAPVFVASSVDLALNCADLMRSGSTDWIGAHA